MKLTPAQKRDVENSIWVVNTALKRLGHSRDEDLRQQALLYMCRCRLRFDETRGVKWTTYAYSNLYLYLKRVLKDAYEKQRKQEEQLKMITDVATVDDKTDEISDKAMVETIKGLCSGIEREIIDLRLAGKTYAEISAIINYSETLVSKKMRHIITVSKLHLQGGQL